MILKCFLITFHQILNCFSACYNVGEPGHPHLSFDVGWSEENESPILRLDTEREMPITWKQLSRLLFLRFVTVSNGSKWNSSHLRVFLDFMSFIFIRTELLIMRNIYIGLRKIYNKIPLRIGISLKELNL